MNRVKELLRNPLFYVLMFVGILILYAIYENSEDKRLKNELAEVDERLSSLSGGGGPGSRIDELGRSSEMVSLLLKRKILISKLKK